MSCTKELKILTWNCNSIKEKINELKVEIINKKYDIIGLCETRIDSKYNLHVNNFNVYRFDRNNRSSISK